MHSALYTQKVDFLKAFHPSCWLEGVQKGYSHLFLGANNAHFQLSMAKIPFLHLFRKFGKISDFSAIPRIFNRLVKAGYPKLHSLPNGYCLQLNIITKYQEAISGITRYILDCWELFWFHLLLASAHPDFQGSMVSRNVHHQSIFDPSKWSDLAPPP